MNLKAVIVSKITVRGDVLCALILAWECLKLQFGDVVVNNSPFTSPYHMKSQETPIRGTLT